MYFSVLGSGSKGNSVYIESGSTAILIDAGFSGKEIATRLHSIGRRIEDLDALFVTHEHHDHIHGVGVLSRRCNIPVYGNYDTVKSGEKLMGKLFKHSEFVTGEVIQMQDLQIRSFSVSHDAADPVGFVICNGKVTLAYCTDTGKVSALLRQRLMGCNGLVLEFNHDPQMLKEGPYSLALQQRVRSDHGHLSNADGAEFLQSLLHDQLQYVILAHLSATNNHPDLAMTTARGAVGDSPLQLRVASQTLATELILLEK
ncbi:MAG: MBL fold metallo-hydrolase [Proteobacteria bacterium]|nr:MBL fold metallo-hydrolase [Pseudomonadota bacterium]MBU1648756.1 MBL fold metallo-hydrolase [Pseudomonadota bacterium]